MSVDQMIAYGRAKIGKVTYSMTNRLGEWSMDCSFFVFKALMAGGFLAKGTNIGNTETLFGLNGKLFKEISFSQVKRGDIFVAGHQGASNGSAVTQVSTWEMVRLCIVRMVITATILQSLMQSVGWEITATCQ